MSAVPSHFITVLILTRMHDNTELDAFKTLLFSGTAKKMACTDQDCYDTIFHTGKYGTDELTIYHCGLSFMLVGHQMGIHGIGDCR